MRVFERILVPVDGSRHSLKAVCLAARLTKIHGAELKVFHVIDESVLHHLARFCEKTREALREDRRRTAQAFLNQMRCEAGAEIVDTSEVIVREGIPHEIILEEASAWNADLIVMGKRGERGVGHILVGSVAERVIEFSEVPVLVVTEHEGEP